MKKLLRATSRWTSLCAGYGSSMRSAERPRPLLTVDVVALTSSNPKKVLLIQRKHDPFAGCWALPGGFVEAGEQVTEAARRELREETGLTAGPLQLLGVYDTPGRDPRGWTVSVAYLDLRDREEAVSGADDAADARWLEVEAGRLRALAFDHARIVEDAIDRAQSRRI